MMNKVPVSQARSRNSSMVSSSAGTAASLPSGCPVTSATSRSTTDYGRPAPSVTVVAPTLSAGAARAADELAGYAAAGVERLILAPTGADWEHRYQLAADIQATAVTAR
jgi:hypothetical protein